MLLRSLAKYQNLNMEIINSLVSLGKKVPIFLPFLHCVSSGWLHLNLAKFSHHVRLLLRLKSLLATIYCIDQKYRYSFRSIYLWTIAAPYVLLFLLYKYRSNDLLFTSLCYLTKIQAFINKMRIHYSNRDFQIWVREGILIETQFSLGPFIKDVINQKGKEVVQRWF